MEDYNLDEEIEYKGYWYIPTKPESKVAGVLKYKPGDSICLELIGYFENSIDQFIHPFDDDTTEETIWGETSNAQKVSLLGCYSRTQSYNFSSSFPIVKFFAQYCVIGNHLNNLDAKAYNWADILLPHLTSWCHPGALRCSITFDDLKTITVSSSLAQMKEPIISVVIDHVTTLNLMKGVAYEESDYRVTMNFTQYTYLRIEKKEKATILDLMADLILFEEFLSVAFLSPVKVQSIFLFDEDVYQETSKGEKIFHPSKLFYIQRYKSKPISKFQEVLMSYSDIEDLFPGIIRKWYSGVSDIVPIRRHLTQSVRNKEVFGSTDFLIIIQAVEGYFTRFRAGCLSRKNRSKLSEILGYMLEEFKDIDRLRKSAMDINTIVDSRHYYSHFMNRSEKPRVVDGVELYQLTKKLRLLLICCVLDFIGLEHSKINELINKSYNHILRW